jgi:hypothetical protein
LRFERTQNVPGRTLRGPLLQSRLFRSYAALVSVEARIHGAKGQVYRNDKRSAACLRDPGRGTKAISSTRLVEHHIEEEERAALCRRAPVTAMCR